jgi:hypothetical protein
MATVAFGVAGAVAGSFIPGVGTALGWELGTLIGGLLDPQNNMNLLKDLRVGGSTYGASIPKLWGRNKVAGNIIWIANYINNKTLVPSTTYMVFTPSTTYAAGTTSFTASCNQQTGTVKAGTYYTSTYHPIVGNPYYVTIRINVDTTVSLGVATFTCDPLPADLVSGMVFATSSTVTQLLYYPVQEGGGGGSGGLGANNAYHYTCSFMACFGESSTYIQDTGQFVNRNLVVQRIWCNDILYYDVNYPGITPKQTTIRIRYGAENQTPDSLVEAAESPGNAFNCSAERGLLTIVFDTLNLTPFGNTIPTITAEIWSDPVTVGDVISDIVSQVELPGLSIDVSLCTMSLTGCAIAARVAAQDALSQILPYYFIDVGEWGSKVNFIPRGGVPLFTIDPNDMGAFSENSDASQIITLTRTRGLRSDIPGRVDLTYIDVDAGYSQLIQSAIKYTGDFFNPNQLTVQLSLHATEALQMAYSVLYSAYLSNELFDVSVPWNYVQMTPTDPVYITDPDLQEIYQVRVTETDELDTGETKFKAVPDNLNIYSQSQSADSGQGIGNTKITNPTIPVVFATWSEFALREQDKEVPGFYVWADWPTIGAGGTVYYSADGGTTWILGPNITQQSAMGITTSALPAATGHGYWDGVNTLGIELNDDGGLFELATITTAEVLSGTNVALVGNEVVGFETVVNTGYQQYTLSNLYRGIFNSGGSIDASNSQFLMLTSAAQFVQVNSNLIGASLQVVVVAPGQNITDVGPLTVIVSTPTLTANTQAIAANTADIATNTADITTLNSQVNSLSSLSRTTVNDVNYTTVSTDRLVAIIALTAPRTIDLPQPGTSGAIPQGVILYIKDESGNAGTDNVTISPTSSTIDGTASVNLGSNFQSVGIYHNGTNYFTVA